MVDIVKICQIAEATFAVMCGVALVMWVFSTRAELHRLDHEVKHLRKLLTKVCNGWSMDAQEVSAEILKMIADHEEERTVLEQKIKNLEHANRQIAKGASKNDKESK